jgi:hypothetical protein
MEVNLTVLNEDKLPIKYILGIQEELENFPDPFDIIHIYVVESLKRPDRPRNNFTKHSLLNYHSCGKIENAEKGLEKAIQLGLIEQTNFEKGKESYRILINPFQ